MKEFIEICRKIGKNHAWVQGTGGNISIKLSKSEMLIKASGVAMSDITEHRGLVKVDHRKIADFFKKPTNQEQLDEVIHDSKIDDTEFRPSMETGFHSFLGQIVIHTHPSTINLIACLENGKELTQDISGMNLSWIPYSCPGFDLSVEMHSKLNEASKIIFLENHGLVICEDNIKDCFTLNEKIISKFDSYISLKGIPKFEKDTLIENNGKFISNNPLVYEYLKSSPQIKFLFPDAVVFGTEIFNNKHPHIKIIEDKHILYDLDKGKAEKINDIISLHLYLSSYAKKLGVPRYLTNEDSTKILNLEYEKHRQNQLSK